MQGAISCLSSPKQCLTHAYSLSSSLPCSIHPSHNFRDAHSTEITNASLSNIPSPFWREVKRFALAVKWVVDSEDFNTFITVTICLASLLGTLVRCGTTIGNCFLTKNYFSQSDLAHLSTMLGATSRRVLRRQWDTGKRWKALSIFASQSSK